VDPRPIPTPTSSGGTGIAMLKRIKINWFRCLKEVALNLSPLTVLVGPNASGKSTLLQALDPGYRLQLRDLWMRERRNFMFRFEYDDGKELQREITTLPQSLSEAGLTRYQYQFLRLDLDRLRSPNQARHEQLLESNGANLTNVFLSLGRALQIQIARELSDLVGSISDVDARPESNGNMNLVFQDRWKPDVLYLPREVSDGTMLLLAFLVCRHQSPAPTLLAIEEPERGLHPYLLGELVGILRKLSSPDLMMTGVAPIQIVVATHSAELLNHLRPEEVRFFSRNSDDGSVRIEEAPTDTPEWERAVEEYRHSMRSLWLSGGLGGVPGG